MSVSVSCSTRWAETLVCLMTSVCLAAEFSCELLDLMPGMWAMNTWACEMKSFARYYVLFHVLLLHKYNLIATYQTYHKWWWFLDISLWVSTALFQLAHVCVCECLLEHTSLPLMFNQDNKCQLQGSLFGPNQEVSCIYTDRWCDKRADSDISVPRGIYWWAFISVNEAI